MQCATHRLLLHPENQIYHVETWRSQAQIGAFPQRLLRKYVIWNSTAPRLRRVCSLSDSIQTLNPTYAFRMHLHASISIFKGIHLHINVPRSFRAFRPCDAAMSMYSGCNRTSIARQQQLELSARRIIDKLSHRLPYDIYKQSSSYNLGLVTHQVKYVRMSTPVNKYLI